jgi:hypothetical protein
MQCFIADLGAGCECAQERFASDATAFALRSNPYDLEILGSWDSAESDAANLEWAERFFAAMQPFSAGEVYVNSLDEGEGHRVREAYETNDARLAALKAKFDPTNFFRCNINIPPGICEERAPRGDA